MPQYDKQLKSGMNKFFRRLTVNSPFRNNYFIQTDNNLDWSVSIGSENEEKSVGIPLMNLMMSINYILEVKDKV